MRVIKEWKCDLCGEYTTDFENNPFPLAGRRCCERCFETKVKPSRSQFLKVNYLNKD